MKSLALYSAALALATTFFISCSAHLHDASKAAPSIDRLYLSSDGGTARVVFGNLPSGRAASHYIEDNITLLHEQSGITITCPLAPEKNGYTFPNYGRLLSKGDRVAVIIEGFSPAWTVIE